LTLLIGFLYKSVGIELGFI